MKNAIMILSLFIASLTVSAETLKYKCSATINNDSNLSVFKMQIDLKSELLVIDMNGSLKSGQKLITDKNSDSGQLSTYVLKLSEVDPNYETKVFLGSDFFDKNSTVQNDYYRLTMENSNNDKQFSYICIRKQ